MDFVELQGAKPYDGRYPFDLDEDPLTNREWHWIKVLSGYMPLTLAEGYRGGDPDLLCAFAVLALVRARKIERDEAAAVFDRLGDLPYGSSVRLTSDGVAAGGEDDGPPPTSSPVKPNSSGEDSLTSSEDAGEHPASYGIPDLGSSPSALATSET